VCFDLTNNLHTDQSEVSRMSAFYVSMSALKNMPLKISNVLADLITHSVNHVSTRLSFLIMSLTFFWYKNNLTKNLKRLKRTKGYNFCTNTNFLHFNTYVWHLPQRIFNDFKIYLQYYYIFQILCNIKAFSLTMGRDSAVGIPTG
jgi:hypothetical protein